MRGSSAQLLAGSRRRREGGLLDRAESQHSDPCAELVQRRPGMVVLMRHAFLSRVLLLSPPQAPACRIAAQETQVIEISAERFTFNPSEIRVKAGTRSRFACRATTRCTASTSSAPTSISSFPSGDAVSRPSPSSPRRALHVRVLEVVRRRSRVHARRHHRHRVYEV